MRRALVPANTLEDNRMTKHSNVANTNAPLYSVQTYTSTAKSRMPQLNALPLAW